MVITHMPKEFWGWLDQRQKELDLNDSSLARKAKIAPSVISKARNDVRPIGRKALASVADALDTPVSTVYALAGYIEPEQALTPEQAALLKLFNQMSEDDREEILAVMRVRARRGKQRAERQKA